MPWLLNYWATEAIRMAHNAVPKDHDLKSIHIAVIDDDDSVRKAMANLISVLDYSVHAFASAEAFLNSGLAESTACIITDVQMPGISGVELQRRLLAAG